MNIIELKPASLYPANAGSLQVRMGDLDHHSAYMVLGRVGDEVMVIEGTGQSEIAAIEHLLRKVKLVRDFMDLTCHGEFWPVLERDHQEKRAEMKQALAGLMGGSRAMLELPSKKKDDDDGGMS